MLTVSEVRPMEGNAAFADSLGRDRRRKDVFCLEFLRFSKVVCPASLITYLKSKPVTWAGVWVYSRD